MARGNQLEKAGITSFLELIDVARGNTSTFFDDDLALAVLDVKGSNLTTQTLGHQFEHQVFTLNLEHVGVVEHVQNFFCLVAQCAQQNARRQLAATVDTNKDTVFRVKLEVQPGAAVRNHASRVQQLAGTVRLATIVVEEHTRAAVQLGNDDTLGTIDDEGTVLGHQGDFPHVDFLLLDVLDRLVGRLAIKDDQAHFDAQRYREGNPAQHTFLDVEGRLAKAVTDVFEGRITGIADNGENRFEGRVQTDITDLALAGVSLEKLPIGVQLNGQQVGHIHHMRQFAKVLADTFFLSI